MKNRKAIVRTIFIVVVLSLSTIWEANAGTGDDVAYASRGAGKMISGVFAVPQCMLQDSTRVMFPFGLVTGAIRGVAKTVGNVVSGAVDMARGASPYAKYAVLAA